MKLKLILGALSLMSIPASFAEANNPQTALDQIVYEVKDSELQRLAKGCVQEVRSVINEQSVQARSVRYNIMETFAHVESTPNSPDQNSTYYSLGSMADVLAHAVCLAPINDSHRLLDLVYPLGALTVSIRKPNETERQFKTVIKNFEHAIKWNAEAGWDLNNEKRTEYKYVKRLNRISLWNRAISQRLDALAE